MSDRRQVMKRFRIPALVVATAMMSLAGCGEGAPSGSASTEEGTIKGTVTIKGKKATDGQVSFDPTNKARPNETARKAEIGKDGSYTVKTLVGDNVVRVTVPGMEKDRTLIGTQLNFEVKPGENTYEIVLPPPN
ncbi:hypothetical protein SAMN05444166_8301 [Singulisphaera sp. GP187]|uniref:hypothetical protein n=1 Tax=Singulisphaera sp. GP187 TaxID=1882752 RepID=UPI00092B3030|nr:hypothetical protein [Singulisphaera sp. GP187]SIO67250.1 hypothetical protein SAMN05444166_8301 [Singulisphaera sp. GP187]